MFVCQLLTEMDEKQVYVTVAGMTNDAKFGNCLSVAECSVFNSM